MHENGLLLLLMPAAPFARIRHWAK